MEIIIIIIKYILGIIKLAKIMFDIFWFYINKLMFE